MGQDRRTMQPIPRRDMNREGRPCKVPGCDERARVRGWCKYHYARHQKGVPMERRRKHIAEIGDRKVEARSGYVYVKVPRERHPAGRQWMQEHRLVMEDHLGRALHSHETVHHANGDRGDNRLENLELWSSWQPPGQRVEDKIAWARELLTVYGRG